MISISVNKIVIYGKDIRLIDEIVTSRGNYGDLDVQQFGVEIMVTIIMAKLGLIVYRDLTRRQGQSRCQELSRFDLWEFLFIYLFLGSYPCLIASGELVGLVISILGYNSFVKWLRESNLTLASVLLERLLDIVVCKLDSMVLQLPGSPNEIHFNKFFCFFRNRNM
ncbi:MAG: hypothetical protein EZS28_033868 [Streblomastix strix]|uniref:Uncharacterized protein n=1 Tax=Streblomastix strix TaxID=222440 RepID=A0A5J4UIH0_9EUKA|nr:MAG: hypothetical protein EZS28_033868 [Streblomastix strix]